MPRPKSTASANASSATIVFEPKLWLAADKLRNNMDAAEYEKVVLGLHFLKYISDTFEEHRAKLAGGQGDYTGANPEDQDEYGQESNAKDCSPSSPTPRNWNCYTGESN